MADELEITTYSVPEPYRQAIRSLRKALCNRGFWLAGELDVSWRVEQALGIALAPCIVMIVWPSESLLKSIRPSDADVFPLHVVIADRNQRHTDVHVEARSGFVFGQYERLSAVQDELAKAIGTIAMRPAFIV